MLSHHRHTIELSLCAGTTHGDYNTEATFPERNRVRGKGNNPDPVYFEYEVGNDLGYVKVSYPSTVSAWQKTPAFAPVYMRTETYGNAHAWLHSMGGQWGLAQSQAVMCNPVNVQRYGHLQVIETLVSNLKPTTLHLRARFRPNNWTYQRSLSDAAHPVPGGWLGVERCVRCQLSLMHPFMPLTSPNRRAGTLVCVWSFVPDDRRVPNRGRSYRTQCSLLY